MARRVTAPDGTRWRVARQWWVVKHHRDGLGNVGTAGTVNVAEEGAMFAWATFLFGLAAPLLVVATVVGEKWAPVVLGVSVAAVVLQARRRTWRVLAEARGGRHLFVWRVRGWRRSAVLVDRAAEALEAGREPPRGGQEIGGPIGAGLLPPRSGGRGGSGSRRGA